MQVELPLGEMTAQEKLDLIEFISADLEGDEPDAQSLAAQEKFKLSLTELSPLEKIELRCAISETLADDEIPMPDWHKEVLDDIERRVEAGEEKFLDLETVWEELEDHIRDRQNARVSETPPERRS